jgi:NifU-like protein involved in Fe-S cluster formation
MSEQINSISLTGQSGEPGQGPWMRLVAEFDGKQFIEASFETYGCPTAMRCGDWVCQWITSRSPQQVKVLEPNDLITVLGGVPLGKEHCADLAVNALRDVLRQLE